MIKLRQKGDDDKDLEAKAQITPGTELYGFLYGLFGRDSYGTKTVKRIEGNHIIATDSDGVTVFSREIGTGTYTWQGIIEASNRYLRELEEEEAEE